MKSADAYIRLINKMSSIFELINSKISVSTIAVYHFVITKAKELAAFIVN